VLAYALIGLLSNSLWDRFIWAALSLAALAMTAPGSEYANDPPPDDVESETRRPTGQSPRSRVNG
jgi:hypothetical protein